MEYPLIVQDELLPQVEEFKYLGISFISEGRVDRETDRGIESLLGGSG